MEDDQVVERGRLVNVRRIVNSDCRVSSITIRRYRVAKKSHTF